MLKVEQCADGTWAVFRDGTPIKSGLSNAAAWREADRLDSQAQGMEEMYAKSTHRQKYSRVARRSQKPCAGKAIGMRFKRFSDLEF
jgi:hypothetical protein